MTTNTNALPLSFYIPRVGVKWSADDIEKTCLSHMGKVDRVDLGDVLDGNDKFRSAFVHMEEIYCYTKTPLQIEFSQVGHIRLRPNLHFPEFWMLLPNKNPVPRTHLNIHQIAAITKKQDERIAALENENIGLKQMLGELVDAKREREREREVPGAPFFNRHRVAEMDFDLDDVHRDLNTAFYQEETEEQARYRSPFVTARRNNYYDYALNLDEDDNSTHSSMPELVPASQMNIYTDDENELLAWPYQREDPF